MICNQIKEHVMIGPMKIQCMFHGVHLLKDITKLFSCQIRASSDPWDLQSMINKLVNKFPAKFSQKG